MNELDFSFELRPWEAYLDGIPQGSEVSAARLLTLLEEEDELGVEAAVEAVNAGGYVLDISGLPRASLRGEAAVRLRQEMELVRSGLDVSCLEETDPLRLYLEEVASTPSCGDETLLAQWCGNKSQGNMEQLANLGLSRVVALAQEYVGYGVLLLDLIQEGSLGLWLAIQDYRDGDYAAQRDRGIRRAMGVAVLLQARAGGVGEKMRTAMEDYRAVDERLLSDLGRNPTLEEIALEMHITPEEAEVIRKNLADARSLAQAKKQPEPQEETQEEEQAVEDTAQFQMRQRILDLLSGLSKADAELLTLRFGLEGGLPLSPEDTGKRLGLTASEVVDREAQALSALRSTR